jgi:hypothetical protein
VALRPDRRRRTQRVSSRPPALLLDLAAGRRPEAADIDADLCVAAADHRLTGLLWTWARERPLDREIQTRLVMKDLAVQAHLGRVWSVLESTVAQLDAAGIESATMKGVTAEARWYGRRGERPCSDVDLLLAPHQLDRAAETVAILQPDHPWVAHLEALVRSRRVQAVTLRVDGIQVDLHLDLLKLGIRTRGSAGLWDRTIPYPLPGGGSVRVLDDTSALMHLLVHLNKDRFQRLLGFADIARIVAGGQVDWDLLRRDAEREGIEVAVFRSLETVMEELELPWPAEVPRPRGPRALVWNVLWHRGIRLRGTEGRLRFRMRQNWIAVLARGRAREAMLWWMRDLWPSAAAVNRRYAGIRGPYAWKLLRGRVEAAILKRREIRRIRRHLSAVGADRGPSSDGPGTDPGR